MKNNQNVMTTTSRENKPYIAPKMEVAILCEDVVMISTRSIGNLYDESGNSLEWDNEGWTSESANQKPAW